MSNTIVQNKNEQLGNGSSSNETFVTLLDAEKENLPGNKNHSRKLVGTLSTGFAIVAALAFSGGYYSQNENQTVVDNGFGKSGLHSRSASGMRSSVTDAERERTNALVVESGRGNAYSHSDQAESGRAESGQAFLSPTPRVNLSNQFDAAASPAATQSPPALTPIRRVNLLDQLDAADTPSPADTQTTPLASNGSNQVTTVSDPVPPAVSTVGNQAASTTPPAQVTIAQPASSTAPANANSVGQPSTDKGKQAPQTTVSLQQQEYEPSDKMINAFTAAAEKTIPFIEDALHHTSTSEQAVKNRDVMRDLCKRIVDLTKGRTTSQEYIDYLKTYDEGGANWNAPDRDQYSGMSRVLAKQKFKRYLIDEISNVVGEGDNSLSEELITGGPVS